MIRVILHARRSLSLEMLAGAIRAQGAYQLLDHTDTDEKLLNALEEVRFDVLLFVARAAKAGGGVASMLNLVRACSGKARVVVLSEQRQAEIVVDSFRRGAKGFLSLRHVNIPDLYRCIEQVHRGQIWANAEELQWIMHALESSAKPAKVTSVVSASGDRLLTSREEDVVALLVDGLSNKEIARTLNLSEHTIKNYLFRIYDKLGISSRTELLLYVMAKREVDERLAG